MKQEYFKLDEVDPEDIGDVLGLLDKSFNLSLPADSFKEAKTFGDICEVFETNMTGRQEDDCTSQQAFYKVRAAIAATQLVNKNLIEPGSRLEGLFPRASRRRDVRRFTKELGVRVHFLGMKLWVVCCLASGILLSLGAFFFSWRIALTGLVAFSIISRVAARLGKELEVDTVGALAKRLSSQHYRQARRRKDTVNRNEIRKIIKQTFADRLTVDENELTADASLGWR
jgi:hypothetical protein